MSEQTDLWSDMRYVDYLDSKVAICHAYNSVLEYLLVWVSSKVCPVESHVATR